MTDTSKKILASDKLWQQVRGAKMQHKKLVNFSFIIPAVIGLLLGLAGLLFLIKEQDPQFVKGTVRVAD